MIAADRLDRRSAKLLVVEAVGSMRHLPRTHLASLFSPGDLVIANDAATLPASLPGTHGPSGDLIEVRLAAWLSVRNATRFIAVAFGAGDYRTRTEDRAPPPPISPGDRLWLGSLVAVVERLLDSRCFVLTFVGDRGAILGGLARSGSAGRGGRLATLFAGRY